MLDQLLDVFRLRQYFNVITRGREWAAAIGDDIHFLDDLRRAMSPLPFERRPSVDTRPFPPLAARGADERPVALLATGGSGALASVVGVARALEELGRPISIISLCSGSSLFGFPVAAGVPADEVAEFTCSLRPTDYLDPDWGRVARAPFNLGRGLVGLLRGDAIEATYRRFLGDRTLADLPIPAYAPIWNIEQNRVAFIGPRTWPELPVARAVRMAIALPLFIDPAQLDGSWWCDGGIVDILPVEPVLDLEPRPEEVIVVNGFYPPGFAGESAEGWEDRPFSILHVASQVRTCQQLGLARENLRRLHAEVPTVHLVEPVPYTVVRGAGFYRQFFRTDDWAGFMRAGREVTLAALGEQSVGAAA